MERRTLHCDGPSCTFQKNVLDVSGPKWIVMKVGKGDLGQFKQLDFHDPLCVIAYVAYHFQVEKHVKITYILPDTDGPKAKDQ